MEDVKVPWELIITKMANNFAAKVAQAEYEIAKLQAYIESIGKAEGESEDAGDK